MHFIPNLLTIIRIIAVPFLVVLMDVASRSDAGGLFFGSYDKNLALFVFILASITDFWDGKIARRYQFVTTFGKIFDPVADKLLVGSALIMLMSYPSDFGTPIVPGWLVVAILARETIIMGIRTAAANQGLIITARDGGKWKTGFQVAGIIALMFGDVDILNLHYPFCGTRFFGLTCLYISLYFSLLSFVEYSVIFYANYRKPLNNHES